MKRSEKTMNKAIKNLSYSILFLFVGIGVGSGAVSAYLSDCAGLCAFCVTVAGIALYSCFIKGTAAVIGAFQSEREQRDEWHRAVRPRL
jgi:hypothetical protein